MKKTLLVFLLLFILLVLPTNSLCEYKVLKPGWWDANANELESALEAINLRLRNEEVMNPSVPNVLFDDWVDSDDVALQNAVDQLISVLGVDAEEAPLGAIELFDFLSQKIEEGAKIDCSSVEAILIENQITDYKCNTISSINVPIINAVVDGNTIEFLFYDDGKYLSVLSLTDSTKSKSIQISSASQIKYECIDYVHNVKNEAVSKDGLFQFFNSATTNSSNVNSDSQIEVQLKVSAIGNPLEISVETNLPDGFKLQVSLYSYDVYPDPYYMAQDSIIVKGGKGKCVFSRSGKSLRSSTYTLEMSSILPNLMSESLRNIIGNRGELLTGKYVKSADFDSNYNLIEYSKKIKVN